MRACPSGCGARSVRRTMVAVARPLMEGQAMNETTPTTDTDTFLLVLNDPEGAGLLVQRFAEIWEVSQPAVTGTTLGL